MTKHSLVLLMSLTLLDCRRQQSSPDLEQEKQKLLATDIEFSNKSVERGAAEAFGAFLAADAIQLPAGEHPIVGRDSIYKKML